MVATHLPTLALTPSESPDAADCRWALAELADLIDRAGPATIAGMVLRQAQQELRSVLAETPARVIGPLRVRRAA